MVGVVDDYRSDFYEKELSFHVSCSYGPGRYDQNYEENGIDYPVGFVRWTEQRNFEAVLDMMARGTLDVQPLISKKFDISDGAKAISMLTSNESSLGILLDFPVERAEVFPIKKIPIKAFENAGKSRAAGTVAFIGAGNFAGRVLMPAFKSAGATMHSAVSAGGVSAVHFGKKFNFEFATTDIDEAIEDKRIDTVVIATRHLHAGQVLKALQNGKHVFCEKPLCLNIDELSKIQTNKTKNHNLSLMVGFNRRFAPHVVKMKELLDKVKEPKALIITVNAGEISSSHWTQNKKIGGGRMIGEGCHFIDLARFLVGRPIKKHQVQSLGGSNVTLDDKLTVGLTFEDGSIASINYLANGHRGFPKERIEVFTAGRTLQLDNFRRLTGWGWGTFKSMRLFRQDKGHFPCVKNFIRSVRGEISPPIPINEIFEVSKISIEVADEVRGS